MLYTLELFYGISQLLGLQRNIFSRVGIIGQLLALRLVIFELILRVENLEPAKPPNLGPEICSMISTYVFLFLSLEPFLVQKLVLQ